MKTLVVGAGYTGLASAALLAGSGMEVEVLEKNAATGGKARRWREGGFSFDMGPSWYLMPDVFERFFGIFGKRSSDLLDLTALDPLYRVFFDGEPPVDVRSGRENLAALFDSFEPEGGRKLAAFLDDGAFKYGVAQREFLYREYRSLFDFLNRRMLADGLRLDLFGNMERFVSKRFQDRRSRQILQYAMVFLGTSPSQAPALYSLMSHVDLNLGVHYPQGGLAAVADAIRDIALEMGAVIRTGEEVRRIEVEGAVAKAVHTDSGRFDADVLLVSADYPHAELKLLDAPHRSYSEGYWSKRVIAPSMFILYLGIGKKLENLAHHNLHFAEDWGGHFRTVFEEPGWPRDPCFYMSCTSKSDPRSAPPGKEALFVLVPVAPGLEDTDEVREAMAAQTVRQIERVTGESIAGSIEVMRIFSQRDFASEYNAFHGTALGLAHTLLQTAVFRPAYRSRKVSNLYYAGQYTHPGIGVPMTLISAEIVAEKIRKEQT